MQTKKCTNCDRELPLEKFHKHAKGKYGRASWCKRCCVAYDASPKRKAANIKYEASPKGKNTRTKYRASPERKAADVKYRSSVKRKAANAKYKASPKGKAVIKAYLVSPEGKAAQAKYRASPERKVKNARYGFKRRSPFNINPELTTADWNKILNLWKNRCAYCGAEDDLEQDHIIPVSRGGKHEAANVIPSCRKCNIIKGDKSINELPLKIREVIEHHYELLGAADISIIEQECLYAAF